MYPTTEIRWFFRGPVTADAQTWFEALGPDSSAPACRTDTYLLLPGNEALGVKLREGMIEVKRREDIGPTVDFAPGVAGRIEDWRKWSFVLCEVENDLPTMLTPASAWMNVQKRRRLCHFALGADGAARPLVSAVGSGCMVELTEVELRGEQWWTIAFECFADQDDRATIARKVIAEAVVIAPPPALPAEACFGYPALLAQD